MNTTNRFLTFWLTVAVATALARSTNAATSVDFTKEVKPILELYCVKCHGVERPKGGLRLDTLEGAIKGGDTASALAPGKSASSPMYTATVVSVDDDKIMPPKKEPKLSKAESD